MNLISSEFFDSVLKSREYIAALYSDITERVSSCRSLGFDVIYSDIFQRRLPNTGIRLGINFEHHIWGHISGPTYQTTQFDPV